MWEAKVIRLMAQDDLLTEWQTEVLYSGIIASTTNEISQGIL